MSDPEVPKPEQKSDVDDVVGSANAGLADAAAARGDVPNTDADAPAERPVDPDLAAFEEAERSHPGTFGSAPVVSAPAAPAADSAETSESISDSDLRDSDARDSDARGAELRTGDGIRAESSSSAFSGAEADPSPHIADTAYASAYSRDAETQVVPSEPVAAPAPQPQPIFVQAPEPPRERNNRGTAAAIGLLATLVFALLYLGTALGLGALAGDVTGENFGEAALSPLTTWGYWVPVVVFFIGFWLLGAIINRGRWGLWVVFGLIVGVIAYAGHILGQLFEAPFWNLTASEGSELIGAEMLAPLAIAAFVFGRELTIWFGAWVARIGARKTELNAEAQREYERTLEAGPTLSR